LSEFSSVDTQGIPAKVARSQREEQRQIPHFLAPALRLVFPLREKARRLTGSG